MASPNPPEQFSRLMYAWLASLDPGRFRGTPEQITSATEGLEDLKRRAAGDHGSDAVATAWSAVGELLPETAPTERLGWLELRDALAPSYDDLARAVRAKGGNARTLHPTNFRRSLVHLLSGLAVVFAFVFVFTPFSAKVTATAFIVWAWSLEAGRKLSPTVNAWCMWFFGPIARDHEHYKVNAATWYGTALFVLAFTGFGPGGVLGLLALAVGDPAAGIIGRRFGRIRLGAKSLEGTAAFALSSALAGSIYLFLTGSRDPVELIGIALLGGVAGAVIELLSTRLEDNFTIPVGTAWVLQAVWFGFPAG